MKKGSILGKVLFLLIIGAIAAGGYYYYINFAKVPSQRTQKTATTIPKYTNSTSWEVKDSKNVCILPTGKCAQPVLISFTTADSWGVIYGYYKTYLGPYGWTTNSSVVTSIPTSVVFYNKEGDCEAALAPKKDSIYEFRVACQDQ